MSILTEKRTELVTKLEALEMARKVDIDSKVEAYRAALEAQTPRQDIDKVKAVINALDEVIAYDTPVLTVVPEVKVEEAVVEQAHSTVVEPRPGIASVFAPSRE